MNIKNIDILGINYKVEEVDQVDKNERLFGEINYIDQTIKIEKDLTDERKIQVLIHEITHGICEQLNIEVVNKEEHLVQIFANGVYQVFKRNKDLLSLIN